MPDPSTILLWWLVLVNLVTAAAYAYDKLAAPRGGRRIRERMLWLLCVLGGVAGAWIVFLGMRHKTLHRSFWLVQSVATVAWAVIVGLVLLG
jgi:uncharacterized membrane protein YsdA (DUF1294 family)